ncbi:hypothetical protein CTI14_37050, partial [Methylobacterium radiotolerans]
MLVMIQVCLSPKIANCSLTFALMGTLRISHQLSAAAAISHGMYTHEAFCSQICCVFPANTQFSDFDPRNQNRFTPTTQGVRNCTSDTPKFPMPAWMPSA